MGTVTFDTNVQKTVDITKTVELNVDKDIVSTLDLEGSLATAEASADVSVDFFDVTRIEPLLLIR